MTGVCKAAERFLLNELEFIKKVEKFAYTDDTSEKVYNIIRQNVKVYDEDDRLFALVSPFRPRNPWSSVIGQTTSEGYEINMRRFVPIAKDFPMWVGNAVHEFCHKPCGYSHPFRKTKTRRLSVPYFLGDQAAAWARENIDSLYYTSEKIK